MITNADIKKMKVVFATKKDLQSLATKEEIKSIEARMATKEDLKLLATKDELKTLNSKMDAGFVEIINFIGEVKEDIIKELNDFRNEVNEFKYEMRDINRKSQSTLDNHESRIVHLEYINK